MKAFTFQAPANILFEAGASRKLAELVSEYGAKRVLLVTDRGVRNAGLTANAEAALVSGGYGLTVFDDVKADPPSHVIERAVALCRDKGIELVASIGGGSALDTAKLVAYLAKTPDRLDDIYGVGLAKGERLPLLLAPIDTKAGITDAAAPTRFAIGPVMIYLAGYFLFGAGYIAYMTFMIAYVRDAGGGAAAQSAFWCLIGLSAFATPWVWRGVLALDRGGVSTTIILTVNAVGASLPLFGHSMAWLAASALVFGVSFFAIVGSTTAFVRFNYPPSAWPTAIAAMTIAFGVGQILGPIATGAITDALGSLSYALNAGAAMLALGAIATAFQRRLARTSKSA